MEKGAVVGLKSKSVSLGSVFSKLIRHGDKMKLNQRPGTWVDFVCLEQESFHTAASIDSDVICRR